MYRMYVCKDTILTCARNSKAGS